MAAPLWFVPDTVVRPAHVPLDRGFCALHDSVPAPWVQDAPVPGTLYGGDYRADGWHHTADGWWWNWQGVQPQDLVRITSCLTLDGVRGVAVPGCSAANPRAHDPGHRWVIPRLLLAADPQVPDGGFRSALPARWTQDGWVAPGWAQPMQQRLRRWFLNADQDPQTDDQTVLLVVDLLAMGYHVSAIEMAEVGWIDEALVERVLFAAVGIDLVADAARLITDSVDAAAAQEHG